MGGDQAEDFIASECLLLAQCFRDRFDSWAEVTHDQQREGPS